MTWLDLEKRFRDLAAALQWTRLDRQTGSSGERYRLAGSQSSHAEHQFETLASIAGEKLGHLELGHAALNDAPTNLVRWYRYLCLAANGRFFTHGPVAREENDDGSVRGHIFLGTLNLPAEVSATQCLELHHMDKSDSPAPPASITLSGSHARINVNSVDNSTNSSSGDHVKLFSDVRTSIEKHMDGEYRDKLLARLKALEDAVHKPSYGERFAEFMADAKDVITIISPFVASLSLLIPS